MVHFPDLEVIERARRIFLLLSHYVNQPIVTLHSYSAYTHLIAVLLSARCQDVRVNSVTPKLFSLADTPEKMIDLSIETIQSIVRPCGLSLRKSTSIWELSKILIQSYKGEVPQSLNELKTLPGVGQKTASVVATQIFNEFTFPVDTHIQRLAVRWGLSLSKSVVGVEKSLRSLYEPKDWGILHLRMIYYGRIYCVSRGHRVRECPICFFLQEIRPFNVL